MRCLGSHVSSVHSRNRKGRTMWSGWTFTLKGRRKALRGRNLNSKKMITWQTRCQTSFNNREHDVEKEVKWCSVLCEQKDGVVMKILGLTQLQSSWAFLQAYPCPFLENPVLAKTLLSQFTKKLPPSISDGFPSLLPPTPGWGLPTWPAFSKTLLRLVSQNLPYPWRSLLKISHPGLHLSLTVTPTSHAAFRVELHLSPPLENPIAVILYLLWWSRMNLPSHYYPVSLNIFSPFNNCKVPCGTEEMWKGRARCICQSLHSPFQVLPFSSVPSSFLFTCLPSLTPPLNLSLPLYGKSILLINKIWSIRSTRHYKNPCHTWVLDREEEKGIHLQFLNDLSKPQSLHGEVVSQVGVPAEYFAVHFPWPFTSQTEHTAVKALHKVDYPWGWESYKLLPCNNWS